MPVENIIIAQQASNTFIKKGLIQKKLSREGGNLHNETFFSHGRDSKTGTYLTLLSRCMTSIRKVYRLSFKFST
jgi:hypothetical protein